MIEYVLSYKTPSNGPATITDTLSANQTYVSPSLQAVGWTYTPASPYSIGNSETYSSAGTGAAVFTLSVPAISGSSAPANLGGDGFQPIPVAAVGHVYGVWHHKPDTNGDPNIMCWNLSDLSPCGGFPKPLAVAGDRLATPFWPHHVIVGSKIYFPAAREIANPTPPTLPNTTADLGIGCWETANDTPCAFITLPGNPTASRPWSSGYSDTSSANDASGSGMYGGRMSSYLAGLATDPAQPTHLIVDANNQLYCIDVATSAACAAWASSPPLSGFVAKGDYRDIASRKTDRAPRACSSYTMAPTTRRPLRLRPRRRASPAGSWPTAPIARTGP